MAEMTPAERAAAKGTLLMSFLAVVPTARDGYSLPSAQVAAMEEQAQDIRAQMAALDGEEAEEARE